MACEAQVRLIFSMRYWYSCSTECKHVFGGGISKMKSLASGKLIRLHPMIDKKCHLTITKKKIRKIVVKFLSEFLCFEDLASNPKQCSIETHSQHGQPFSAGEIYHWRNGGDLSRKKKLKIWWFMIIFPEEIQIILKYLKMAIIYLIISSQSLHHFQTQTQRHTEYHIVGYTETSMVIP